MARFSWVATAGIWKERAVTFQNAIITFAEIWNRYLPITMPLDNLFGPLVSIYTHSNWEQENSYKISWASEQGIGLRMRTTLCPATTAEKKHLEYHLLGYDAV
jgi:hypothetical protein